MRLAVKALLIAAATAAGLTLAVSPALAGSYTVNACSPSGSPGVWTQTNSDPSGLAAGAQCGGPAIGPLGGGDQGALYAEDILTSPVAIPNGAEAGWTFTAPPSTTISAISYYRALAAYSEPDLVAGLFQASGAPLEQCMIGVAFGSSSTCSMPNSQAPVTFSGLNTSGLFFGVVCHVVTAPGASCVDGGTIHYAQADLYSAQVTLTETALPTLAQLGGALWGGGVASGTVPVTFAASDPSGIQQALVRSDTGQTLSSAPQACSFTLAQPCPELPAGSLSVDTARVSDGPHTFTLTVTDAAGNSQNTTSPSLLVDNNGPPAPSDLTATPRSSTSNAINLTWKNPANPTQPISTAIVQLCQTSCPAAMPASASGIAQLTAPAPGTYTVRLWLIDSRGRGGPQNAATASVTVPAGAKPSTPGSTPPGSAGIHTKLTASIKGRELRVSGTLAALTNATVKLSWRSRRTGKTLASGSKTVKIHNHKINATFTLTHKARTGTVHIAVRTGTRIRATALARRQ